MRVDDKVLAVLSTLDVEGNSARITKGQLERKLYLAVNAVLEELGGKWNRKSKTHVFAEDPRDMLDVVIATGEVTTRKELGFFPTPPWLARALVGAARVQRGHMVLEPSAGEGAIALAAREAGGIVMCVEVDDRRVDVLREAELETWQRDFLSMSPSRYFDRVVMNPPFSRQLDIDHVRHALGFVKPGGTLAAIMSAGVGFRENRKTVEFRELVSSMGGGFFPVHEDAFRESGTGVRATMLLIDAPEVSS